MLAVSEVLLDRGAEVANFRASVLTVRRQDSYRSPVIWSTIDGFGEQKKVLNLPSRNEAWSVLSPDGTQVLTLQNLEKGTLLATYRITGKGVSSAKVRTSKINAKGIKWNLSSTKFATEEYRNGEKQLRVFTSSLRLHSSYTIPFRATWYWQKDGRIAIVTSDKLFNATAGLVRYPSLQVPAANDSAFNPSDRSVIWDSDGLVYSQNGTSASVLRPFGSLEFRGLWKNRTELIYSFVQDGPLGSRWINSLWTVTWRPGQNDPLQPKLLYKTSRNSPEPEGGFHLAPLAVIGGGVIAVSNRNEGDRVEWIKDGLPFTIATLPAGEQIVDFAVTTK